MSDIVERLRTGHPSRQTIRDVGHLLGEAADEIERLRAALSDVARLAADDSPWFAEIARAALKGTP
jgi:hypothetical protein